MSLPVVILAGGLGTRLGELTRNVPKALVDVAGQPFLAHQLELLRANGAKRVVFCISHLGDQIQRFTGDGRAFGLDVVYSFDGPVLLGTAGALRQAAPLAASQAGDAFFVLYGDSYLPCDFRAIERSFNASGRLAMMTVFRNEGAYDTSNVEYGSGEILRYDKRNRTREMRHIDYGLGVLRRSVFDRIPAGQIYDLAALYQELLSEGQLAAYEVPERFYEVGSVTGLEELAGYLKGKQRASMEFIEQYLSETLEIVRQLDRDAIARMVRILAETRSAKGRLFMLGVGGSAANASHAVNDFRKIAGIETYAPTDNVSELTARTNDEGWATVFESWLRVSQLTSRDTVFILSVGGGNLEQQVSPNLVTALQYAKAVGSKIIGIVGRDGGYTAQVADAAVIIPTVHAAHITPHSEAFQAVVWHLLVSHPTLKQSQTKWESLK